MDDYLKKITLQLKKAIQHLEYSYHKVNQLPAHPDKLDEETLETWESFCARYSRVIDLFLMKYLKAQVRKDLKCA